MSSNLHLGPLLAEGRTAEIFRLEGDRVLKLFRPGWGEGDARYEAGKAEAVYAAGLPAPAVHGVTQVDERFGIVYQEIVGRPLMESLRADRGRFTKRPGSWRISTSRCTRPGSLPCRALQTI